MSSIILIAIPPSMNPAVLLLLGLRTHWSLRQIFGLFSQTTECNASYVDRYGNAISEIKNIPVDREVKRVLHTNPEENQLVNKNIT